MVDMIKFSENLTEEDKEVTRNIIKMIENWQYKDSIGYFKGYCENAVVLNSYVEAIKCFGWDFELMRDGAMRLREIAVFRDQSVIATKEVTSID